MKPLKSLARLFFCLTLLLAACGSGAANLAGTGTPAPGTPAVARSVLTSVASAGIGNIAVRVTFPQAPRYAPSAGVVVIVPPLFDRAAGFDTSPDVSGIGLIQVSFLWPGQSDKATHAKSDGNFDGGGENSLAALRDVLRFASGLAQDKNGRYITNLTNLALVTPLPGEVGLYAFGDAGFAALDVLALYGDQLQNVKYLVGYENPSGDTTATLELGYYDSNGLPVLNPTYDTTRNYAANAIKLDYSNLRWDGSYKFVATAGLGRPYLDQDGSGSFTTGDFAYSDAVPLVDGKRYYSAALTQALLANGALTTHTWPSDVATPDEAAQFWQVRSPANRFLQLGSLVPSLEVMLVFSASDHAQVQADKPHIHQLYQGLRYQAPRTDGALGLWVRLNPDRAYVQALIPGADLNYPDNPANTQPGDWSQIAAYAEPDITAGADLLSQAGLAEMADRTHYGDTDLNLGQVLNTP